MSKNKLVILRVQLLMLEKTGRFKNRTEKFIITQDEE